MTDQDLIEHITDLIMNDEWLMDNVTKYVRAYQGRSEDEDVTDVEVFWEAVTTRFQTLALKSIVTWSNSPKQEELIF